MSTIISGDDGVDKIVAGSIQFDDVSAGMVIQVANFTTGSYASGTATIPNDDTVPQNTEGTEFLSLAFTPKKIGSKLLISVELQVDTGTGGVVIIGSMFKDSDVSAKASGWTSNTAGAYPTGLSFKYEETTIDTSLHTYKVRVGGQIASTIYLNGSSGARKLGGSLASSITITEIAQ